MKRFSIEQKKWNIWSNLRKEMDVKKYDNCCYKVIEQSVVQS